MPPKKKSGKTRKARPAPKKKPARRATESKAARTKRELGAAVIKAGGAYWRDLIDAGYLRGPAGAMTLDEGVLVLTEAIYHLLAGGTITGTVPGTLTVTPGIESKVNEFNRRGIAYLDAVNRAGGPAKLRVFTGG